MSQSRITDKPDHEVRFYGDSRCPCCCIYHASRASAYGLILTNEERADLNKRLWQIEDARRRGNHAARKIPV